MEEERRGGERRRGGGWKKKQKEKEKSRECDDGVNVIKRGKLVFGKKKEKIKRKEKMDGIERIYLLKSSNIITFKLVSRLLLFVPFFFFLFLRFKKNDPG